MCTKRSLPSKNKRTKMTDAVCLLLTTFKFTVRVLCVVLRTINSIVIEGVSCTSLVYIIFGEGMVA